jgi:hypothetical protein
LIHTITNPNPTASLRKNKTAVHAAVPQKEHYLFLCRFFLSFFLRLWVAIFLSLRFLPQGTSTPPFCLSAGNLIQYEPGMEKGQEGELPH